MRELWQSSRGRLHSIAVVAVLSAVGNLCAPRHIKGAAGGSCAMPSEPPSIIAVTHNHVMGHAALIAHLRGRSGLQAQLWG